MSTGWSIRCFRTRSESLLVGCTIRPQRRPRLPCGRKRGLAAKDRLRELGGDQFRPGLLLYPLSMAGRTNKQMLELLGGDPEFYEPNSEPVSESLVGKLREGFKEVEGCVVPQSFQERSIWSETRPRVNNVDDETSFECSLSKIHLEDFVARDVPLSELARLGCAYAMYLRRALLDSPVSGNFRIIVDAQIPHAALQGGNVCSVRFHRIRPDQAWLATDLESYKENALLVFDFEKTC